MAGLRRGKAAECEMEMGVACEVREAGGGLGAGAVIDYELYC